MHISFPFPRCQHVWSASCDLRRRELPRVVIAGLSALLLAWTTLPPAAAEPLDLVRVAPDRNDAGFADLAVGADGTLHALWQDKSPEGDRFELLYAASFDGVNWTDPLSLGPEGSGQAGVVSLEIDGTGRAYAFWKIPSTGIQNPGQDAATLLGATGGPLFYRVLDGGVWSEPVPIGRGDHAFGWYSAVDEAGRVHVVWSESDGPFGTPMAWLNTANVIQAAVLDGTQADQRQILRDEAKGFFGLHGFVDAAGTPVFVALADGQVFLWNGAALTPVLQNVTGNSLLDAAWLLQDSNDGAHLIYHDKASAAIAHWPVGPSPQSWIVYQKPGGEIEAFQAWQGTAEFLLTVEAQDAGIGGADLEVVRYRNGRWEPPVDVTGNSRRDSAAGVFGVETAAYHQAIWSARYGIARSGPGGAVDLLLVNSSVETARGDMGIIGGSAALAHPQVFFTRLGQPLHNKGATPRQSALTHGGGAVPDPPSPGPAQGGLPPGSYACEHVAAYVGRIPNNRYVAILAGGFYVSAEGTKGRYAADGAGVTWISGPYADGPARAVFGTGENGKPMLTVTAGDQTEYCELR